MNLELNQLIMNMITTAEAEETIQPKFEYKTKIAKILDVVNNPKPLWVNVKNEANILEVLETFDNKNDLKSRDIYLQLLDGNLDGLPKIIKELFLKNILQVKDCMYMPIFHKDLIISHEYYGKAILKIYLENGEFIMKYHTITEDGALEYISESFNNNEDLKYIEWISYGDLNFFPF